MTRRATILLVVVLFCVGTVTLISASDPGDLQPDTALDQQARRKADRPPPPPGTDVADEIFRIRDEVDLDIFAGTTLDRDEDRETPSGKDDAFQSKLADLLHRPLPPAEDTAAPATDGSQLIAFVAKLRDVSARIDQVAHRLELQRQYHEADNLRGIGQEVRAVARSLDSQSMPVAEVGNRAKPTR